MNTESLPTVVFLHPSDELYGADRQLLNLVLLARSVCRPVVVLPDDVEYAGKLTAALRDAGIEVIKGPVPVLRRAYLRPAAIVPWLLRAIVGMLWLIATTRHEHPCAIVTNTTAIPGGPVAAFVLRRPHILYVRELIESPRWYPRMVRILASLPGGIVLANSRATATWLGRVKGRETSVMYNSVPPSDGIVPMGDEPTAIFVGRLNEWKGWEVFISAAARVHSLNPASRFLMAGGTVPGTSITDAKVQARIDEVDPSGSWLTWVGEVDDTRAVMQRGWVVVAPSQRPEPFGNVVIEGMAEARPVVGTNMGGIPEIIEDGVSGLLVTPGDERPIADALERLLSDRGLTTRMGQHALERYTSSFTPQDHAAAWKRQLERVMAAHRG